LSNQKKRKEATPTINEVIKLKFGKVDIKDVQTHIEIIDFLAALKYELQQIEDFEDDDDIDDYEEFQEDENQNDQNKPPKFDREMIGELEDYNAPEEFIPFVVVRKDKTTVDLKCPYCNAEDKLFLSNFKRGPYIDDHECHHCHKKALVKLDFKPSLKVYIAQEVEN